MVTRTWERLIERLGSEEAALAYGREQSKSRRDKILSDPVLGPLLRAKEREKSKRKWAKFKKKRDAARAQEKNKRRNGKKKPLKTVLCAKARMRGRRDGREASIKHEDLSWPEYCPVLGLKLDYATVYGQRDSRNPALPSLDRWDNAKGYIKGNVFVISLRANQLKNNATADELEAVARYARTAPL